MGHDNGTCELIKSRVLIGAIRAKTSLRWTGRLLGPHVVDEISYRKTFLLSSRHFVHGRT